MIFKPGDALYLEGGCVGEEPLKIKGSGTVDRPVLVCGYGLRRPKALSQVESRGGCGNQERKQFDNSRTQNRMRYRIDKKQPLPQFSGRGYYSKGDLKKKLKRI